MNDDSKMIGGPNVIQFRARRDVRPSRWPQTAEPLAAFSPAFRNRVRHAVARACRTDVAALDKPLDNLLLSVVDGENELIGGIGEYLDNSKIVSALDQVREFPERTERDCTPVLKYMERLSEPQRSIVMLRWVEGLTYREIAKRVHLEPRSVCRILSQHVGAMSDIYSAAPAALRT